MSTRRGCGLLASLALFVLVACLVFAALSAGLFLTGELPAFEPRLTDLAPRPGDAFGPTTPITLTFDQPMDPSSVEASFALAPAVPGAFAWNDEGTQVVFLPSSPGFEPGMHYRARLAEGARGGLLPRTTRRAVEWGFTLPPLLAASSPAPGAGRLGAQPVLTAHFSYALDCHATSHSFLIEPSVRGSVDCQEGTWSFTPDTALIPDHAYRAILQNVYLEGDPTPRPGLEWQFRTAPPLLIVDVAPAGDGPVADLWTPVRITFNRPPQPATVEGRFRLADANGAAVEGEISWEDGGATLVFQPRAALKPHSTYRWLLEAGVQDALGFSLADTASRPLETAAMVVADLDPVAGEMILGRSLRLTFTRPMDRESVVAGLLVTPTLQAEMAWEGDTLVFTPRDGWRGSTDYQVHLGAGVRDASGAPLGDDLSWSFRSEPFLLEASVPSGEVLRLTQPLELRFALPMDRASVARALTISPETPGELLWNDGDRRLTFQPLPGWLPGAGYRIALSGTARAAGRGQDLGRAKSWTFDTGEAVVRFGSGPNLQVVGVGGNRAVQLAVQGADGASFRLYAITDTQLLELYNPGFWAEDAGERRLLDTSILTPTLQWQAALLPLEDQADGEGWWLAEASLPAAAPPGLYLLCADPPAAETSQLLLVLTSHRLVLKRALAEGQEPSQILVWDSDIQDGTPVVSATLRLYDAEGALLATAETDENGLAGFEVDQDPGPLWVLADREGDGTMAGLGAEWNAAGWWSWGVPPPRRPAYTIYAYTDRPVYRPGQNVYFRAIVRTGDAAEGYALPPPGLPVQVRLRDARDNLVATQVLTPTRFGTVHGEFRLADEPALGTWQLEVSVDDTATPLSFDVQEFRPAEVEVVVATPRAAYSLREAISVTVTARTFFGQAVAGAEVELRAYPGPESWYGGQGLPPFGQSLVVGQGRTDGTGQWSASLTAQDLVAEAPAGNQLLVLEAAVSGETGQTVTSYSTLSLQPVPYTLGLELERHFYAPREEISLAGRLQDLAGEPLTGVELQVSVVDRDGREMAVAFAQTDEAGEVHFSMHLEEQGRYRLRLFEALEGTQVEDWLWICTGEAAPQSGRAVPGNDYLSVGADREKYQVGDEALVIVEALAGGPALLTLERGTVLELRPLVLVAGTNLVTVPIQAAHVPNVYLKVSQFGPSLPGPLPGASQAEARLHTAGIQLLVPAAGRQLDVAVTLLEAQPGPGEEVSLRVQVADADGRPAIAEVSLAVIDEALAALQAVGVEAQAAHGRTAGPFDAFYAPRPNNVSTFDSFRPSRALLPEGGMGGSEGQAAPADTPRRSFLDTAYWAPAVVTGADGQAVLTLALPDNLTTWSVLARAVTTDTRVGEATARIVVSQEISLRPAAPRFLVEGDTFTLSVAVHNAAARPVSATVRLDSPGLILDGEAEQLVHVPAGSAGIANWPLRAGSPGQARLSLRATATYGGARLAGRDAVVLELPILPLALPEESSLAGSLGPGDPPATLTLTLPVDALPGLARLELDLAATPAAGLLAGFDYLLDDPHRGVEQTASRVLSSALIGQAFRRLGGGTGRLEAELPGMVGIGLQQLYGSQHEDGGWGWGLDDDGQPEPTAYVLLGLAMARQAGFQVDAGVVDRAAQGLATMLPGAGFRDHAYGAYALAMAGRPLTATLTISDALGLDAFSQAALAVAAEAAGDSTLKAALLTSLRQTATLDGEAVYWQARGQPGGAALDSSVRTTALVAHALARLDPSSPLLPGAALWLMDQRVGRGWGDTQRTSFALLALADLVPAGDPPTGTAYQVTLNGAPWQRGVLQGAAAAQTLVLTTGQELSPTLLPGENRVGLLLEGEGGRLHYVARLHAWRSAAGTGLPAFQALPHSIGLEREIRRPGGQEPAAELRVGEVVEVVLTFDVPRESWYVVVEDPLPAGLEALNDLPGRPGPGGGAAAVVASERKEVRDERVVLFFTSLSPGHHTVRYLARTIVAGRFATLPARAYLLYEPAAWSRSEMSEGAVLKILP